MVVEKQITVAGKTVVEHLEAIGRADAVDLIMKLSLKPRNDLTLEDLLSIHQCILQNIDRVHTGVLRDVSGRISGSRVILPNPLKVPALMDEFLQWLTTSDYL